MTGVVQATGEVVANRSVGVYRHLTLTAPGVAALARPGQFAALAVGGPTSANLLRRCFSLHKVTAGRPRIAGLADPPDTLDIVIAAKGPGTVWLAGLRETDPVDVIAPLGQPFPMPDKPVACVLVGGGYGSAPLFWLAATLRERGCRVEMVLGAASVDRLFGPAEAVLAADRVTVTTDDGSAGTQGWVSDVLGAVIDTSSADVVYGCGPMGMLESVTSVAHAHGAAAYVAVEEAMACGVGVCMTCVLPVRGADGVTAMVRSCVAGPVFRGDRIRWEAFEDGICRVPADALGAARVSVP